MSGPDVRGGVRDAFILHAIVLTSWVVFGVVRLLSRRFRRALRSFEATYQFRTASAGRQLIFSGGRIRTRRGIAGAPDFELVLLDPPGVLNRLRENPNDMLALMLENKIDQRGNQFYLFKYGYLWGLCLRFFEDNLSALRALPVRVSRVAGLRTRRSRDA